MFDIPFRFYGVENILETNVMKNYLLILVAAYLLAACSSSPDALASSTGSTDDNSIGARVYESDMYPIVLSENAQKYLNSSRVASSNVAVIETGSETFNEMKNLLSEMYDVRVHSFDEDEIWFEKEGVQVDLSELESNRKQCANGILKTIMPSKYADKYMLVSVDEEWLFSENEGSRISGYTFNFKRLFEGRVVRNNRNNLYISTDGNGLFKDGQITIQDLKMTPEIVPMNGDVKEYVATLDSIYREQSYSVVVCSMCKRGEKKVQINKVIVTGVADAYCRSAQDSDLKLWPCISYTTKESLADGDTIARIVDAPYSRASK